MPMPAIMMNAANEAMTMLRRRRRLACALLFCPGRRPLPPGPPGPAGPPGPPGPPGPSPKPSAPGRHGDRRAARPSPRPTVARPAGAPTAGHRAEPDTDAEPAPTADPDAPGTGTEARPVRGSSPPRRLRSPGRPLPGPPHRALGGGTRAGRRRRQRGATEGVVTVWSRKGSRNLRPARGGVGRVTVVHSSHLAGSSLSHAPSPPCP